MIDGADGPAIAERFDLGEAAVLTGPVARGELGQIWRLATRRGAWAVKEPFDAVLPADAAEDARYIDAVRAGGVFTPRPVRSVSGDVIVEIDGSQVRVFEWVDLGAQTRALDPVAVGGLVAAIHRVDFDGTAPTHWWYTDVPEAESWDDVIADLVDAGAPFAVRFADLRDELVALATLAEPASDLRTCHRDLFSDNVMPAGDGRLCVVDWDNSGLADPAHELALVLFEYGNGELDRVAAIYGAYVGAGGPARIERPGQFAMAVAVLGHLGLRACRLWLDAERVDERDRRAAAACEFVDEPLTRSVIDAMIERCAGRQGR